MPEPGVDWSGLMRLGLGVLRLSPAAFWAMTPVELRHALEGAGVLTNRDAAMDGAALTALMAAYPDRANDTQE